MSLDGIAVGCMIGAAMVGVTVGGMAAGANAVLALAVAMAVLAVVDATGVGATAIVVVVAPGIFGLSKHSCLVRTHLAHGRAPSHPVFDR